MTQTLAQIVLGVVGSEALEPYIRKMTDSTAPLENLCEYIADYVNPLTYFFLAQIEHKSSVKSSFISTTYLFSDPLFPNILPFT